MDVKFARSFFGYDPEEVEYRIKLCNKEYEEKMRELTNKLFDRNQEIEVVKERVRVLEEELEEEKRINQEIIDTLLTAHMEASKNVYEAIKEGEYISKKTKEEVYDKEEDKTEAAEEEIASTIETKTIDTKMAEKEDNINYKTDPMQAVQSGNLAKAVREDKLAGSSAVTAQINNIRYKYISGKAAGQDLYDQDGKLIIAKGEIITSEVIGKAEAEGKLPELIVNMVIPGMEE